MTALTASATVTGTTGPGNTITAGVLANVTNLEFDFAAGVVNITYGQPSRTITMNYSTLTTATLTISGVNTTIVLS